MNDQAFWEHVDHQLRENEHIMRTKVRARKNFRNEVHSEAKQDGANEVVHTCEYAGDGEWTVLVTDDERKEPHMSNRTRSHLRLI